MCGVGWSAPLCSVYRLAAVHYLINGVCSVVPVLLGIVTRIAYIRHLFSLQGEEISKAY